MTVPQYLAVIGAFTSPGRVGQLVRAASRLDLDLVFQSDSLTVLANPTAAPLVLSGQRGVVVGTVFHRSGNLENVCNVASNVVAADAIEKELVRSYWGAYVAFACEHPRRGARVFRDPSGSLGCYWNRADGVDVVYSDVALAQALGLITGEPDPTSVAHHLTFRALRVERTALAGVHEVLPGTSVTLDGAGAAASVCAWTPWVFGKRDSQIADRSEAIALLRAETQRCVSSWAEHFPSILHELSGGLDSSIVAACLSGREGALSCINLVTPDPGADERSYAQRVADRIDAPMRTAKLDVAGSDLAGLAESMTVRPGSGMLYQVLDRILTGAAEQAGADACFSGGGGDHIFCYLQTAAPAVDALRRHGPGMVFLRSVRDLAGLHDCTAWRAGRLALTKACRPLRSWPRDIDFLAKDRAPTSPDPHPWLEPPPGALHGQQEHILSLTAAQGPLASQIHHGRAAICYPLLSQPLVEVCLRIPSWMWISEGRNRAVARDAFADQLPPTILQRRTKGDFGGFQGALFEKHRNDLAGLLLDGWLASHGLLDREAIEAYLKSSTPLKDYRFSRLMDLATAEVWARSWLEQSRSRMAV